MSNNPIPKNNKVMLALAEDCFDGVAKEDEVGLKAVRQSDLSAQIEALKGDAPTAPTPPGAPPPPPPAPPTPGLIYLYDAAKVATGLAEEAVTDKDKEVRQFLVDAHSMLETPLGKAWSPEWVLAGYTEAGSTAVPNSQDKRFASIGALSVYLTLHPTYQILPGGPLREVTAARAQALNMQISHARTAANAARNAQKAARDAREAGYTALRRLLIALVDELTLRMGPDDPRWEIFGLNIPSSPRAPEPAKDLTLSLAGDGQILAGWTRGMRSDDNRILIQVVGVDADYREYGKSGNVMETVLKDLPAGAVVKVKIIALNGSLEATSGPEAQISMPVSP
jgi:hypothetical protein